MEPAESPMMIVYFDEWYIVDAKTLLKLEGPFQSHESVINRIQTRAWRIAQGWAP